MQMTYELNLQVLKRPLDLACFAFLVLVGCSASSSEQRSTTTPAPEEISELVLRGYLQYQMDTFEHCLPDTLALSIEREKPPEELLSRLSDLDTQIIGISRSDEFVPTNTSASKKHRIDISLMPSTSDDILEVRLIYTVSRLPHGFSVRRYFVQEKGGLWEIVEFIDSEPER